MFLCFSGATCEDIIKCASNPCENGGTCEEQTGGLMFCICPPGFTGIFSTLLGAHHKRNIEWRRKTFIRHGVVKLASLRFLLILRGYAS